MIDPNDRFSKYTIAGLATNIDEYVPINTPTIRAKENRLITSPPNKNKIITTIIVVRDVIIVRFNVIVANYLIEEQKKVFLLFLFNIF